MSAASFSDARASWPTDEAVAVAEHEYAHAVRIAAFQYLDQLRTVHGDALPWQALARGYVFDE